MSTCGLRSILAPHRGVLTRLCLGWLVSLLVTESAYSQYPQNYPLPPSGAPASLDGFADPNAAPFQVPLPQTYGDPTLNGYMTDGLEDLDPPTETLWSPTPWLQPTQWDRSIEFGLNSSEGNAQAFSLRAGGELTRKTEWNEYGFDISYAKATADNIETQHNALFNANFEQFLGDTRWTMFDKLGLEYDEFRAFDLRFWLNAGVGYQIIKTDSRSWKGRFGAGASREFGGPVDEWLPEAVFGTDYEHQLGDRQKLKATADYYPAWEDFTDYRLVIDLGWEVLLNEQHNLSLKVSVNDRYDSTPHGRRPNDLNYAMLLLWKL